MYPHHVLTLYISSSELHGMSKKKPVQYKNFLSSLISISSGVNDVKELNEMKKKKIWRSGKDKKRIRKIKGRHIKVHELSYKINCTSWAFWSLDTIAPFHSFSLFLFFFLLLCSTLCLSISLFLFCVSYGFVFLYEYLLLFCMWSHVHILECDDMN